MAKNEVSVTLKAYDQTAAAFKSAEKSMDRLVRGAKKVGSAFLGIFAAKELGSFLKNAVKMAAEADSEVGKSLTNLTQQFQDAQIAVGSAILGNKGIVFGLEVAADALKLFAVAIEKPADAIKAVFTNLWNSIGWIMGKLIAGIGTLTNNKAMKLDGERMQDNAVLAMANGKGTIESLIAGTRGRSAGLGKGKKADRLQPASADYGPAGEFLRAHVTSVRGQELIGTLLPDPRQIADRLDQVLADQGSGIAQAIAGMKFWTELREGFANQVGRSIADAFAFGIEAAIASGSIGDGFKALSGALLSGLGSAMIEFGTASLMASTLMDKIKTGLMSFLPGGAIAASLAMIGIGAALKGVASRAFGGMGAANRAVSGSLGGTGAEVARPEPLVVYLPHGAYAKADSPEFQEFIAEVLAKGAGRGIVFRPA